MEMLLDHVAAVTELRTAAGTGRIDRIKDLMQAKASRAAHPDRLAFAMRVDHSTAVNIGVLIPFTNSMTRSRIPDTVKEEVENIVDRFNRRKLVRDDCYYEARFKGRFLYLDRCDYGRLGPICRLTYTGNMSEWEFAIFKWSSEKYDPDEWMFPGTEQLDGTIEGAMKAGLEAYPP